MKPLGKEANKIRLQVFLSRNGVASRRKAMQIVQEGHVTVNGKQVLEPSTPVDPHKDKIGVEGKTISRKAYKYLMINKPKGFVTTKSDRFADRAIIDLLPNHLRHLNPVGRLDKDTEGLLLFTNDGNVVQKLTHPSFHIDKIYYVRINGLMELTHKERLEKGVYLGGQKTAPANITNIKRRAKSTDFIMTIHEGRKRQIRLMLAKTGYKVLYLKRIAQGPIKLGNLKLGRYRELSKSEVQKLIDLIN